MSKSWTDGNGSARPGQVSVSLLADGQVVATAALSEANQWTQSFGRFPIYREGQPEGGERIVYTIAEDAVAGYVSNAADLAPTEDADGSQRFELRNTFAATKSITVTKSWGDWDNAQRMMSSLFRPNTVNFTLTGTDSRGSVVYTRRGVLLKALNYTATISGLPVYDAYGAYIQYRVEETNVPPGYIHTAGADRQPNSDTTGNMSATLVNTLQAASIRVEKTWSGIDPSAAPEVTVTLYANGTPIGSAALNSGNGWAAVFGNLPRYGANGAPVAYTLTERALPGFVGTITGAGATGEYALVFTVHNAPGTGPEPPNRPNRPPYTEITDEGVPLAGAGTHKHLGDCFD